mgnify:CR=1 FL=1
MRVFLIIETHDLKSVIQCTDLSEFPCKLIQFGYKRWNIFDLSEFQLKVYEIDTIIIIIIIITIEVLVQRLL